MESFHWATTVFACAGGLFVNLLNMVELGKIPPHERPVLDWIFWVPYFIWPIIGGSIALAYQLSNINLSPILGLQVGVTAPLIIRSMANTPPSQQQEVP